MSRRAVPKANRPAVHSTKGSPMSRRVAPKANRPAVRCTKGRTVSRCSTGLAMALARMCTQKFAGPPGLAFELSRCKPRQARRGEPTR